VGAGSGPIGPQTPPEVEGWGRPSIARVYDYYLDGKDNLLVDRQAADRVAAAQPLVVAGVRANRAFVRRAIAFLAETGIGQFLEVGSGLPTARNVHEVTGRINPQARTTYIDNDPIVLVHARALLADNARTIVADDDVRDPGGILADKAVQGLIDFDRPFAVVLAAILHFVQEDPAPIVRTFRDAMAPGNAIVITHVVDDGDAVSAATRRAADLYSQTTAAFVVRSGEQVASRRCCATGRAC
jgi:SAM-dependent methyltransferase